MKRIDILVGEIAGPCRCCFGFRGLSKHRLLFCGRCSSCITAVRSKIRHLVCCHCQRGGSRNILSGSMAAKRLPWRFRRRLYMYRRLWLPSADITGSLRAPLLD